MAEYKMAPERYVLKPGDSEGAPPCPYGNTYKWIGFDLELGKYVRFTKSVFKLVVNDPEKETSKE